MCIRDSSGLGCTLAVLFMGFPNIPDNQVEVIPYHVTEIFIITDMGLSLIHIFLIDFANQCFHFVGSRLGSSQTPALFRYIGTLLSNLRFLNGVNKFRPVISGIFSDSPERVRNQCQNSTLIDTVLCRACLLYTSIHRRLIVFIGLPPENRRGGQLVQMCIRDRKQGAVTVTDDGICRVLVDGL